MVDRVRPLVLEQPGTGGTQLDYQPTEVDPTQDGVDARAFFAQSGTSADNTAYLSRTGANLTLTDASAGTKNAADLVTRVLGAVSAHASLVDGAHFIGAPAEGWASGAYFVPVFTGPLCTKRSWYTSAGQTQLIFQQTLTYTGPLISTVTSVVYTTTGAVGRTFVDSYSYTNGCILSGISRSWT